MISSFKNSFQIKDFAIIPLESLLSEDCEKVDLSSYLDGASSFYSLLLFEQDTTHIVDSKEYSVKQGECLFVMENSTQEFLNKSKYRGIIILFTQPFFYRHSSRAIVSYVSNRRKRLIKKAVIYRYPFVDDIVDFISEYSGIEGSYRDSRIGAMFAMYFLKMFEADVVDRHQSDFWSTDDKFIEFNQLLIDNKLKSRDVKEYTKEMEISYGVLNRVCKKAINMTPKSCIDTVLTIEAQHLLLTTDHSITKIASDLGFDQPSNFSKYFKKHTGVLPLKFKDSIYDTDI